MSSPFVQHLISLFSSSVTIAAGFLAGAASILAFLDLGSGIQQSTRIFGVLIAALVIILIGVIISSYHLTSVVWSPIRIRYARPGKHFNKGNLVLVLDSASWIRVGQILLVSDVSEEQEAPLCLVRVQTFTTKKYPQCTVFRDLSGQDLKAYLGDSSRWKSLECTPLILEEHLRSNFNVRA
jgi:hypothetical protein